MGSDHSTRYDPEADIPPQPELSLREQDVFRWMREGKRDSEIAILTNGNPRTTEKHAASIINKYHAETRTAYQAIYRVGDNRVGQWSNPVSIAVGV